jgi:hypothetical protein
MKWRPMSINRFGEERNLATTTESKFFIGLHPAVVDVHVLSCTTL